jgi:hypothetical protein
MSKKTFLSMSALLILVAAIAWGCGGGEKITGQELIERVLSNAAEQKTARYEMSMVYNMSGDVEGEYGEMDVSVELDGMFDMRDRKMHLDITSSTTTRADTQTEETRRVREYIFGDIAYIGMVSPAGNTEWVKGDVSEDFWELQNYVNQQVELLRDAEVEILGTEKVSGISCYVAEISPNMNKILELMRTQLEQALPLEITEDSVSNYSLKGWFAKDTFYTMRSLQEFDFTFDLGEDQLVAHYVIDVLIYDHNKPVSIELPAEAEDAEYVGVIDI